MLLLAAALAAGPTLATTEVAGVKFEDKTRLGATELTLNGAGLRTRLMFKVYAIGLYLPERKTTAETALAANGPQRIQIVTLRDLTAKQFAEALMESLQHNNSEAELAAIKPAVDEFKATLLSLEAAPAGANITIDYAPESGTRLAVNGQPKGKPIPGEAFRRALLKVWLGSKPVQGDLKDALLGKGR
ncbi:MAG: chalcone isomerase family protein [Rhodocyclaceae bacterium]